MFTFVGIHSKNLLPLHLSSKSPPVCDISGLGSKLLVRLNPWLLVFLSQREMLFAWRRKGRLILLTDLMSEKVTLAFHYWSASTRCTFIECDLYGFVVEHVIVFSYVSSAAFFFETYWPSRLSVCIGSVIWKITSKPFSLNLYNRNSIEYRG